MTPPAKRLVAAGGVPLDEPMDWTLCTAPATRLNPRTRRFGTHLRFAMRPEEPAWCRVSVP